MDEDGHVRVEVSCASGLEDNKLLLITYPYSLMRKRRLSKWSRRRIFRPRLVHCTLAEEPLHQEQIRSSSLPSILHASLKDCLEERIEEQGAYSISKGSSFGT